MVKGYIRNKKETYTWLLVWQHLELPAEIAIHVSNYLFDSICLKCGMKNGHLYFCMATLY
jgi:hypothetical protein